MEYQAVGHIIIKKAPLALKSILYDFASQCQDWSEFLRRTEEVAWIAFHIKSKQTKMDEIPDNRSLKVVPAKREVYLNQRKLQDQQLQKEDLKILQSDVGRTSASTMSFMIFRGTNEQEYIMTSRNKVDNNGNNLELIIEKHGIPKES
ncbi:uncharacterized protein VNE69_09071 [Vairimorpha necatrix]|uniref:Uncharacterized protein n=1 Tax=Vairimorpha necatrix TaxID=6039 RepID=A0AAX4JF78_9MICR